MIGAVALVGVLGGMFLVAQSNPGALVDTAPATPPVGDDPDASPLPVDHGSDTPIVDPAVNLAAFMAALRTGEASGQYNVLVGGRTFSDYSHHPGWTDASMTKKSAWGANGQTSHAAGAYQFQPGTYKLCSVNGGFSPADQDAACIVNLQRLGAYEAVVTGNIALACVQLTSEWTSLSDRGFDWVASQYQSNGGILS